MKGFFGKVAERKVFRLCINHAYQAKIEVMSQKRNRKEE